MSEAIDMDRVNLERSLHTIVQQEVPVSPKEFVLYSFFEGRKQAAARCINEQLSEVVYEQMLNYIEYCNSKIKLYLAL